MANDINDIYSFYDSLLTMMGFETKVDGTIWIPGKTPIQLTMDGKKVVLPLKSRLKDPATDEVFFHPLCEQMQRYESDVFRLIIKRALMLRLITSTSMLGVGLIKLQDDPALQRKLNIEQIEVIKNIKTFDKNSLNTWSKMMNYGFESNKNRVDKWPVNIFLKRNGQFDGKTFRRVAVVSFPFFEEIANGARYVNDAGKELFSNKAYTTFTEVFQAIWPDAKEPGELYNAGWNDPVAPYLSATLLTFKKMSDRLNYLCDLFADPFEEMNVDTSLVRVNCDWHDLLIQDGLKDYTAMSGMIPHLKGNTGATSEDEAEIPAATEERPARRDRNESPPVKEAVAEEKPKTAAKSDGPKLSEGEQKLLDEAIAKRKAWKLEQEEIAKEDEERRLRREERNRHEEERRSERSRDETPPWDDEPKKVDGKLSASELFRHDDRRDDRGRDRGRDDRDRDYDRGRSDRDRDYDRRDDRDYDRGRSDRDRDFFDRGRDRDSGRRDDRGGPWGRRDDRDRGYSRDRDYGRRDDRGSPWGRR